LILERTTPEKGEAHDEITIDFTANPIKVAFNGNFIIDFLSHIESEDIQINIIDEDSSFIFKPLISSKDEKESDENWSVLRFYDLLHRNGSGENACHHR
jgi:DNA polymerase III sliding clamp (beta) subunit (PCNA family)